MLFAISSAAQAHDAMPHGTEVHDLVGFDQQLNQQIPLGLTFRDENNQPVELSHYFHDKPVILAMSYFECTSLCPLVRQGLLDALQPLSFSAGEQFDVILVSIDPGETPDDATEVKQATVAEYNRPNSESGWHLLTGDHDAIDQLADAVGIPLCL
jgi:protein SCO1/2